MNASLKIQNLKCGGCVNSIHQKISAMDGVVALEIDLQQAELSMEMTDEGVLDAVKDKLKEMGYPAEGDHNNVVSKAKSYVSCAIGRIG